VHNDNRLAGIIGFGEREKVSEVQAGVSPRKAEIRSRKMVCHFLNPLRYYFFLRGTREVPYVSP
ncbi:MAG: hypothetical protein WAN56_05960, partial [Halobacteriota archaeon]